MKSQPKGVYGERAVMEISSSNQANYNSGKILEIFGGSNQPPITS